MAVKQTLFIGKPAGTPKVAVSTVGSGRVPVHVPIPTEAMGKTPYMRASYFRLDEELSAAKPYVDGVFTRQDPWFTQTIGNTPVFINDTGKVVQISRVILTGYFPTNSNAEKLVPVDAYASTMFQVKMGTSKYEITRDFVPASILHTDERRTHFDVMNNYLFELPTPYFMPRGEPFVLEVAPNVTTYPTIREAAPRHIHFALHCTDVATGRDVIIPRSLELPLDKFSDGHYTMTYPPKPLNVVFDDSRDGALRDLLLRAISCSSGVPMLHADWQHPGVGAVTAQDTAIMVRPRPPQGSRWHSDEWFEMPSLARDIPTTRGFGDYGVFPFANQWGINSSIVRHEPVRPYTLLPGDKFEIKFRIGYYADDAGHYLPAGNGVSTRLHPRLGVTLLGHQEG